MRRAVVALFALLVVLLPVGRAQAQTAPALTLSLDAATIGQPVTVRGTGFPTAASVSLQLCGNQAARGSIDCDVVAGQTVVTNETGDFQSQLVVRFPPVPCPCVVWASTHTASTADATAPIGVVTAPFANPAPAPPTPAVSTAAGLEVVHASVRDRAQWKSWLGIGSDDELVVTLRNPGSAAIEHPLLALTVGTSSDPTKVIASPAIGAFAPGEQRTIVVPFHLSALSFGHFTVKGSVGSGDPEVFTARVWVLPWLAPLLLVCAAAASLVAARRIRRRRRASAPTEAVPDPVPDPATAEDDASVDGAEVEETGYVIARQAVEVTFTFPGSSGARTVAVCGDFNDWSHDADALHRFNGGDWEATIALTDGMSYRYRFLIDGERWENDAAPDALVPNEFGGDDCLVVVGFADRHASNDASYLHRHNGHDAVDAADDQALGFGAPPEEFWANEPEPILTKVRRWRKDT